MTAIPNSLNIIPNFEDIKFVNSDGYLTDEWRQILLVLMQNLQKNIGPEGLVAPNQTATNITTIQNNKTDIGGNTIYTCQFGTILYNSTANSIQIAINNGSGAPIFKTVTLT